MRTISFDELETADLYLDAIYKGGTFKNVKDDPLGRLLPVGNQGGFRYRINRDTKRPFLCVLYSDFVNPDWPDRIDEELGLFTYFGDNRTPGHELHETSKGGNKLLRSFFAGTHSNKRDNVPPLFVFSWAAEGRDVISPVVIFSKNT